MTRIVAFAATSALQDVRLGGPFDRLAENKKRSAPREERVSRTYWLPLSKLRAAKRALGAATEALERALDLAVFQRELVDGTRAMLGIEIASPDLER